MDSHQIAEIVIAEIRETVPDLSERAIGLSDSMAELGLDSIERSEIILVAMERLGLKIPLVELHGSRTIGELAELLYAKRSA